MTAIIEPNRIGPFPFPKADPKQRVKDFSEVQLPYTAEQAVAEAKRCILCANPVCIDAYPVHMDVRGMFEAVARRDFRTAYSRIRETNMMLGTTSRCCSQLQGLCEDVCVLRWAGQPLSIGMVQRFIFDWERNNKQPDPIQDHDTGKHIVIVGAGPAGLAAAELLKRYGHKVTIYEELSVPGGTAWYGIPDYHLPKDVLKYEIDRIVDFGIEINTNVIVGQDKELSDLLDSGVDAILIATGAKDSIPLNTPGSELEGIYDGYEFLKEVFINGVDYYKKNRTFSLGDKVGIIGGGDSSLDVARTALRLTKGGVTIVYRRTEKEMPIYSVMLDEAKEEGIQFEFLAQPKLYNGIKGHVSSVILQKMKLGEPDETGRRRPVPIIGEEYDLECSSVFVVIGREPNSFIQKRIGLQTGKNNSINIDEKYRTSMKNVFAAGDVTIGETLVVKAMGSGRNAAQRIHEYLLNKEDQHVSLYERYFKQNLYENMFLAEEIKT